MRVLFATRGSSGHLGPLVPFARACEQAGHGVRIAAQEQFSGNVERAGFVPAPFDAPAREEWMPLMDEFSELDFRSAHEVMIGRFFGELDVRAELPRLGAFVERWRPDLIVRESWEFGSTIIAERHRIPIARIGLGIAALEDETIALAARGVDAAGRAAGLPPDPEGARLAAAPHLTTVPVQLDPPGASAGSIRRFRYESAEPSALPPWWHDDDRPIVYLTFGSVAAGAHLPFYPTLYRAAIEVLAPLPIRLLVTIGDPERDAAELGALAANVHVETWVNHDDAAAAADVVVCHGGFGSTLGTLVHGTPLVVVPVFSSDQWDNAEAAVRTGAGVALADDRSARKALELPSDEVISGLASAVESVRRDGRFRSAAEDVATAMNALPETRDAVDLLEAIAGEGHRR